MFIDDKFVTGSNSAGDIYMTYNLSMMADKNDIDGHFRLAFANEHTNWMSWDATDSSVINELMNISHVSKAAMLGLRGEESVASVEMGVTMFPFYVTATGNQMNRIKVGDDIQFTGISDTATGRYVTQMNYTNSETI